MTRTRREEMVLGFVPYPKWPIFASLLALFLGSGLVAFFLYIQLPADFETMQKHFQPDVNIWIILPFLYLSLSIDETKRYRMVCDLVRKVSAEKNIVPDDEQLTMMAEEIMRKLILVRILNGVSNLAILFLMLQAMTAVMIQLVY